MNITMISQVPPNRSKIAKNSITMFVPPSSLFSAARRFIDDTQKLDLVLVSPGGSCVTARRFLEKFQKPDFSSDIHIKCNPNPSSITIHSIKKIKQSIGTPLTWFFLRLKLCQFRSSPYTKCLLSLFSIYPPKLTQASRHSEFVLGFWV